MLFLQAAMAPVVVQIGDRQLTIPKCRLRDIVQWGAQIMEERVRRQTDGMDPMQAREYLTFYPPIPPDIQEMKRMVRLPEGVQWIIMQQLPKAEVSNSLGTKLPSLTAEEIEGIIDANGTGGLSLLAWQLSDLNEERPGGGSRAAKPEESTEGNDPLAKPAKAG